MFKKGKIYLLILLVISFSLFAGSKIVDKKDVTATVVRVYDGDTFYIEVKDWPDIFGKNMPVRIYGIDCPEIKSDNIIEKKYAQKAKFFIIGELAKNNNVITLSNLRRDKYFRILSDVTINGENLARKLLDAKLAREYNGGHKELWNFDNKGILNEIEN